MSLIGGAWYPKSTFPKKNSKTSHHLKIINKKIKMKTTIKTNSPNKSFDSFFYGKNHPLYIGVIFIYSLMWLMSISWEIWYRKYYALRKKINSFKNSISLEEVANLSILPVSYEIASSTKTNLLVHLIIFKRLLFFQT